jgi:hypothetical protein
MGAGAGNEAVEAPPCSALSLDVVRMPGGRTGRDRVAVEEPFEIRIGGRAVAVAMRKRGAGNQLLPLGGLRPESAADLAAEEDRSACPRATPRRRQPRAARALGELDTTRVAVDSVLLANVNTPDELRRLG